MDIEVTPFLDTDFTLRYDVVIDDDCLGLQELQLTEAQVSRLIEELEELDFEADRGRLE